MRILVVEDEKHLAEAVSYILRKQSYQTDLAFDGEYALECALTDVYDIILLDIMLPKLDGISVLKRMRAKDIMTPVIILSAKGEVEDKIDGLDSGADDYLAKPFKTNELLARIRAVSRRKSQKIKEDIISFDDICLNKKTLELSSGKNSFILTVKESNLLEFLITNNNQVVAKEVIFRRIWGQDAIFEDNYVEVYISFLRKKLASLKSKVAIKTVRGLGYKLVGEDKKHV